MPMDVRSRIRTLAFPGLGTIMAKRRVGYPQAALMLLGFAIFMAFMLWFFAGLLSAAGDFSADLEQFEKLVRSRLWIAGLGLGLCAIAWAWALFSSLAILRAARESHRPPALP
jgi:hypothetical protein